ncbi:hypothetical protein RRG08_039049 [Elysia crispata]|uniref:Uncharacterized protein n=1 Tax=Elysia crispata TaxID=231223 RepID=A0AAE0XEB6_9GAST|nr:hypothetical protein RRG08_039049 [Elysia crispata]
MEDSANSGKLSSRSGKISKVVPAGLAEAKQKKPKKKKKGRRNSNKPDIEETNKHTSDEDKTRLEVEGVGALDRGVRRSCLEQPLSGGAARHKLLSQVRELKPLLFQQNPLRIIRSLFHSSGCPIINALGVVQVLWP